MFNLPMSATLQGITYLLLLMVMAGSSTWFLWKVESSLRQPTALSNPTPPLKVFQFQVDRMDEKGIRKYTLTSPYLVQLPAQQGIHLTQPILDIYQDIQTRIGLVRAKRGWISPDSDLIRLQDTVSINHAGVNGKIPVEVNTQELLIYPNRDYAETSVPAKAVVPGGIIKATGFRFHLRQERLELLAEVRGYYAIPKH